RSMTFSRFALGALSIFAFTAGCSSGASPDHHDDGVAEVAFDGKVELLPNLDFSTGLVPSGAPVQASFSVSAAGSAKVTAVAAASESGGSPVLTGLPGRGLLTVDGGFSLEGELKVELSGLPSYDGPIPGLDDVDIPVHGEAAF